ncbi:MAG: hypothetical protein R2717_04275 [Schumannella sp.]|nr:hypothetical protein [Microbacteriaceae bacterium]
MIHASVALPIPVGGDVPPILTVLLGIAAVAVFAVIVWQAVRYFRNGGGDDE